MFIKEIDKSGMVARQGELKSGDIILKVCDDNDNLIYLIKSIYLVVLPQLLLLHTENKNCQGEETGLECHLR